MFLFELATGDIDAELEKTAGDIASAGTADQPMGDPMGGMGGPQMGDLTAQPQQPGQFPPNQPPIPGIGAEGPGPEEEERFTKKVDNFLIANTRGMDFVTKYEHRDGDPKHPFRILQMDIDELSNLKNMIEVKRGMQNMKNEPGATYDTRGGGAYFERMLAFVERAIDLKKKMGQEGKKKRGQSTDFSAREQSKNEKKKSK